VNRQRKLEILWLKENLHQVKCLLISLKEIFLKMGKMIKSTLLMAFLEALKTFRHGKKFLETKFKSDL
jgi:hypothetical protein